MSKIKDPRKLTDSELFAHIAYLFDLIQSDYVGMYQLWINSRPKEEYDLKREQIEKNVENLNEALEVEHFRTESMR